MRGKGNQYGFRRSVFAQSPPLARLLARSLSLTPLYHFITLFPCSAAPLSQLDEHARARVYQETNALARGRARALTIYGYLSALPHIAPTRCYAVHETRSLSPVF